MTSKKTTIINVSNRLPVTVTPEKITKSSGGLVAALEGLDKRSYDLTWIGWSGSDIPTAQERRRLESVLRREHGCIPIFLAQADAEAHYEGFSNSSLWPLLHYMPNYFRYEDGWWEAYRKVNQVFADKVVSIARPGDVVWVHDYQLMLLPAMLRQAMPDLRIGFFLHTPFPSYEVFRCHPRRTELLEGLLGADQVGFHTFGYLRHFRSSVLRLLGLDSDVTRIRHPGPDTYTGVYPIGIHAPKFIQQLDSEEHHQKAEAFRETYRDKHVVLSVERLDYTKGIVHRLDAIDRYLADYGGADDMKFIFVSVPSREGVEEYQALREEIEHRVGRINGKYATLTNSPIKFIHGSVDFADLCALYAIAEVCVVTPLIDGMNLVAKEYIACQRDEPGVLVLSEFAGAIEELHSAIIVNPYDTKANADAIHQALNMPIEERRERMRLMRKRVIEYDAQAWARSFIDDLRRRPVDHAMANIDTAQAALSQALRSGKRVALFLDYDGTLREIEREPGAARPTDAVRATLDRLQALRNADVTIVSGRTPEDLDAFFEGYDFGLIAEHGAAMRRPGSREWQHLDRNTSYAWKDEIRKVLELYEAATPGSFIEDKRTGLVWHYRKADPEFGQWRANQLTEELAQLLANDPIQIRHGRKIVELADAHVNKGEAVAQLVQEKRYDLILCAGDDVTDESMFRLDLENLVTIKVGHGDTQARYRLSSPAQMRAFLDRAIPPARTRRERGMAKNSSAKKAADGTPGRGGNGHPSKPRTRRDDTPEAKMQQERTPKTRPTRAIGGRRKGQ